MSAVILRHLREFKQDEAKAFVPPPDYRTEQEKLENVLHGLKKINQPNRIEG